MSEFYQKDTRKADRCNYCFVEIEDGEKYSIASGSFHGKIFTKILCANCSKIVAKYCEEKECDKFELSDVSEWIKNNICCDCIHFDKKKGYPLCKGIMQHCPKVIEKFQ